MTHSAKNSFYIGIDVGSTTVKAVVVDKHTQSNTPTIVWQDYRRHESKQADFVLAMLEDIMAEFPEAKASDFSIFMTGSGAMPLIEPLGARFVQEVNAVTLAVESLHPDVGSVVELGGQDAKIIIFMENPETGEKQAVASMNDKCASGTGATIDKCMLKVGMDEGQVATLDFNANKLHKVAAKCGVFAETDIVNLIKSGIPSDEVLCSLADAIVMQNLSVLTRGNTLKHKVLLLGGPNTYLPFLQQAWSLRIAQTWQERNYELPEGAVAQEQIIVPDNAQYYAAFGAVVFGLDEPQGIGIFQGLDSLKAFCRQGRSQQLGEAAAEPLMANSLELQQFLQDYQTKAFQTAEFQKGQVLKAYIGMDGGSTSSKAVLLAQDASLLAKAYRISQGNPIADMQILLKDLQEQVQSQGAILEILGFGATGYAADVLEESIKCDVNVVETVAHQLSCTHYFGEIDVICDVGGQDIKVLFMQNGDIKNFRLSNQCSAGNGMLLQAMAEQFGIALKDYASTAFKAELSPKFSYGCAVFLDSDRVNFQKEGFSAPELLAGLAKVLPKNIWQYVVQIPRMAELGTRFVLQGGTQYNLAAVKAQVDYIKQRVPNAEVHVHPHTGEAGAIGAALEARRRVQMQGQSNFIGLEAAINLSYKSTTDASTVCEFCPNLCARTFIDTQLPDGSSSRYIAGFSCEKGTVESKAALKELVSKRNLLKKQFVNLCEYESRLLYRSFYKPMNLPDSGALVEEQRLVHPSFLQRWYKASYVQTFTKAMQRSSEQQAEKRANIRIAIPKVLNIWSTAPLWRVYFETLGIKRTNIVFSEETSQELWQAGGKYGSIDPCYPSKVIQAHYHQLLFEVNKKKPIDYLFNPSITHLPSFLEDVQDTTACPVVSGSPCVNHASFIKEKDYFAEQGVEHVFDALNLKERHLLQQQMFDIWGERLGITQDESDFAMAQAWQALDELDAEMQRRGLEVLQQAEANNQVVILLLARPYHLDPGLNHGVLEEFQAQGYPVLSIRSIPKDPAYLKRWFQDAEASLSVSDVWPENYSTNSTQKLWAAKFAARHPNVAVLDLSSFKCGHDAPTYALIDNVIKTSKTPYMALHDIDANKPAGSLAIRVKTFCHTLSRVQEELEAKADKLTELESRMAEKRKSLYAQWLAEQHEQGSAEMAGIFADYLQEEEVIKGLSLSSDGSEVQQARLMQSFSEHVDLLALAKQEAAANTCESNKGKADFYDATKLEQATSNVYHLDPTLGAGCAEEANTKAFSVTKTSSHKKSIEKQGLKDELI